MSKFLRAAIVVMSIALGASVSQAQTVAMAGQYSEANGIIINIPQNPPLVPCTQTQNARCIKRAQHFFGAPAPDLFSGPRIGVKAARNIPNGALTAGQPFTIPTLAFTQMLGIQVGAVLNNIVVQLDTTLTGAGPAERRYKNLGETIGQFGSVSNPAFVPPPQTRSFSQRSFSISNREAHAQNNGLATDDPNYIYRQAVNTTVSDFIANEDLIMTYSGGAGFSGTMTILLDGGGRLYLAGPNLDANFPPTFHPIVGTNPVGDADPGLNIRNGAGWDYTIVGGQGQGSFKGFPANPSIIGVPCNVAPPATPPGCNLIETPSGARWDDVGINFGPFGGATSVKHVFAFTTGTVSIVRTAVRNAVTQTDTLTGMGYDTVDPTGGPLGGPQRNVGLVAGSYTSRTDGQPVTQLNLQMVGTTLKFTPEPGATVALISGLGLLGAFAARRRS